MLTAVLCFSLAGCRFKIDFSEEQYSSDEFLASHSVKMSKMSVMKNINRTSEYTAGELAGMETLWSDNFSGECDMIITASVSLGNGKAKLVHIDSERNVHTLVECTPDSELDGKDAQYTVHLTKGKNTIKIVALDAEDMEVKMTRYLDSISDNQGR